MKRILAAVNDDYVKTLVVNAAAELACVTGAKLIVCNVMPESEYQELQLHRADEPESSPFLLSEAEEHAEGVVKQALNFMENFNLRTDIVGLVGDPTREILKLAIERDIDLIVVGFEEHRGLGRLKALGSVSRAIMEHAPCPVMVVPVDEDA